MFFGVSADKYKKIDSDSRLNKKKITIFATLKEPLWTSVTWGEKGIR